MDFSGVGEIEEKFKQEEDRKEVVRSSGKVGGKKERNRTIGRRTRKAKVSFETTFFRVTFIYFVSQRNHDCLCLKIYLTTLSWTIYVSD